jgi:hypothetical protein
MGIQISDPSPLERAIGSMPKIVVLVVDITGLILFTPAVISASLVL